MSRSDAEIEQERIRMQVQAEHQRKALEIRKQIADAEAAEREARANLRRGK